jgi:chemotaxis protein histidine kinase CheA
MGKQQPIEIFMPPNTLKAKAGGSGVGIDKAALKRAEAAVETLKAEFEGWMNTDVDNLIAARNTYAKMPDEQNLGALYRASHDIKGQAITFEHPVVARMASSLCKLIDGNRNAPLLIIDAHVNAIRVLVKQNVKDAADPTTSAVAKELEARVRKILTV